MLRGGGMADLITPLSNKFKVNVIYGVKCFVDFAEALVATGIKTLKTITYVFKTRNYTGLTQPQTHYCLKNAQISN